MARPQILPMTALAALVLASAAPAHAVGWSIRSRTEYHAYQIRLRDPSAPDAMRNLNRFYQSLSGGVWGFGPDSGIDFTLSLRYDTDFGTGFHRDTPTDAGIPATDETHDIDLSHAYFHWRDVVDGHLDLTLGRIVHIDDLDFYSFDGLKIRVRAFPGNHVDLYVGRTVQYDALFSSEPFINDGVEVDDGQHLTFGGTLASRIGPDFALSLTYRQEMLFREDDIEVFGRDPTSAAGAAVQAGSGGKVGVQEWLVGGSMSYTVRPIDVELYVHGVWNVLVGDLDQARGGLAWNPSPYLHLGAEYLRVRPRFAGDSIFNWFNIFPYDRIRGEAMWEVIEGLRLEVGYLVTQYGGGPKGERSAATMGSQDAAERGGEGLEFTESSRSHGPSGGVSYRADNWGVGAYGEASTNIEGRYAYGGNFRRGEVFGHVSFLEDRIAANLRFGISGVQDDWFGSDEVNLFTPANVGPRDTGAVAAEAVSYSLDVGARAELYTGVSLHAAFAKHFESALAGNYRLQTALEVRY